MPNYCVNRQAQPSGEHEVHNTSSSCSYLPSIENRIDLGWHPDCRSAIQKAKDYYSNVDGCYYCCRECHSR